MPQIVILAGPNGAGKSTLAARFVPRDVPFLNADNIARTLMPLLGQNADIAAGRLLLARMDEAAAAKTSFALETNLANRTLAARIPRWQRAFHAGRSLGIWSRLYSSGYPVLIWLWDVLRHEFAVVVIISRRRLFAAGIRQGYAPSSRSTSRLSIAGDCTTTRTLPVHRSSLKAA